MRCSSFQVTFCVISTRLADLRLFTVAYIPAIIFWGLDGFFLWQEQLFRVTLRHQVRAMPEEDIDFSMNTSIIEGDGRPTWVSGNAWGSTLVPFHGGARFLLSSS